LNQQTETEKAMGFVNEHIPKQDIKKYGIDEIDRQFLDSTHSKEWTIDRARDIYLRLVAIGREDSSHETTWSFYWRGNLLLAKIDVISTSGPYHGARHGHKRLRELHIPEQLEPQRKEILEDLKEALIEWKDGGLSASATTYTLTLDV
jgi:hypothetical protein